MPVEFDDYEAANDGIDWAVDPDSNAYAILAFLARHPEMGFSPKEIHEATEIPRGSVGTTLSRLEDRGLVRHKAPYWSVNQSGLDLYEAVLVGVKAVEESTAYEWGDEEPEAYRIGLDAVSEDVPDEGA